MMLKFHIQLVILYFFFKRESFLNDSAIIDWLLIYFSLLILMYSLEKRVTGENKNGT